MLVVDLQDAGVRFYTYVSTLLVCLEAAAEAGVDLCVLDRPEPPRGRLVEGPERDPSLPFSLVSTAPGPLVHGLTLGEMALYASARRSAAARGRVDVVPMEGWAREMTWARHRPRLGQPVPEPPQRRGRPGLPGNLPHRGHEPLGGARHREPVPALRGSVGSAPGPGRGASTPPGLALEPTGFTPESSPAAPQPKHLGARCSGLRVRVTDPRAVRPYAFGLRAAERLRREPEFTWVRDGAWLETLVGSRTLRPALERGDAVAEILAADRPSHQRFGRETQDLLLY